MATRIPPEFIDELLARTDIVELIDALVPLKKRGANHIACCPFHQEKTPSFSVSPSKQIYHCFGCGVGGNALQFLMSYQNLHFVDAVSDLAAKLGLRVPEQNFQRQPETSTVNDKNAQFLSKVASFYYHQLKEHPKGQEAIAYLKQRGLDGKTVKKFMLGYAPPGWDTLSNAFQHQQHHQKLLATGMLVEKSPNRHYDRFRDRIMFPIISHRGAVIGFGGRVMGDEQPKYLNSPETALFHKGRELYGLWQIKESRQRLQRIVVVEGYMDVIMLAQYGIGYAVATLGTAATAEHLQLLLRHCPNLVFCFDGDNAGYNAASRVLTVAGKQLRQGREINFVFLPQGEDPDSLVKTQGKQAFEQLLDNAKPFSNFFIDHLLNKYPANSAEAKAKLLHAAKPILAEIPDKTLQSIIKDNLCLKAGLNQERLASLLAQANQEQQSGPLKTLSPYQRLLALLLQTKQPPLSALNELPLSDRADQRLLQLVIKTIAANPELSSAALIERFRDSEDHELLLNLANRQFHIPETELAKERDELIAHLGKQTVKNQINLLMQKANQQGLSDQEKHELQALISASKTP